MKRTPIPMKTLGRRRYICRAELHELAPRTAPRQPQGRRLAPGRPLRGEQDERRKHGEREEDRARAADQLRQHGRPFLDRACKSSPSRSGRSEPLAGTTKLDSRQESSDQRIGCVHCRFVFGPVGPL